MCGFWDESKKDWSTNGCSTKVAATSTFHACHCDHTTFFALIAAPEIVSLELSILYISLVSVSAFFGIAIIYIFARKISTINRG
jgi:hypothetical protein